MEYFTFFEEMLVNSNIENHVEAIVGVQYVDNQNQYIHCVITSGAGLRFVICLYLSL